MPASASDFAGGLRAPVALDPDTAARLSRDGFAVVDLLDAAAVDRLRAEWEAMPKADGEHRFSSSAFSDDLDYRRAAARIAADALGPALARVFAGFRLGPSGFVCKREGGPVPLHQDPSFVDESRAAVVGVWCPLVDVAAGNGCLRVVPGSHRINRRPRVVYDPFRYAEFLPRIERFQVELRVRAGQAVLFTQPLFHGSPPNTSGRVRPVATTVLVPDEIPATVYVRDADAPPGTLAAYDAGADGLATWRLGRAPDGGTRVGFVPDEFEVLTAAELERILEAR